MDFGQLSSVNHIDFSFAPNSAWSLDRLAARNLTRASSPLFVGAPVWNTPEWSISKPLIYPAGTTQKSYLWHYSRHFSAIELNTSFYRIPSCETIQRWITETPDGFKFCPKLFQDISHSPEPGAWPTLTHEFAERCRALGPRLGLPFLQLPPAFSPEVKADKVWLKAFSKIWPKDVPLAVEFRHPAWFTSGEILAGARAFIADQGWSTVITDTAGRRDAAHMTLSSDRVLIRFLGNSPARMRPDLHFTDVSRINAWGERLETWIDRGVQEIYFCIHQPDNVMVPELTERFRAYLGVYEARYRSVTSPDAPATQLGLL